MKEIDYTMSIMMSIFFTLLLLAFYLYKSDNKILIRFLSFLFIKNRYRRAEIQKDTRVQDTILMVVLITLILMFGVRIIYFQAVVSDSMKPVFVRGDIVMSQALIKEPHVGDIVTFQPVGEKNVITHRVINVQGGKVSTKGDNNPIADDYGITNSNIIAKAVTIKGQPIVIKGVGSYFILDFSKEGMISKFGDKFEFLQQMFLVLRTWGYVITVIALFALIMMMIDKRQ